MIQVLLYPDALSMVGSMNAFEIYNDSKTDVVFALRYQGAEQNIVQHTYTPNDEHRITVDVKDIILPLLAFELKDDSTPYVQENIMKAFSAEIYEVGDAGNRKEFSFSVIRAGVDKLADSAENFLKNNFLTWQPQVKAVTYYSPEFLTYYAAEACAVKCKAYLWNGTGYTESEITLAHLTEGCVYTIPVQYAIIAKALNQKTPSYYDVWVEKEGGDRLTYVQRYYASDMKSEEEEWFLFENSLGGVDCFRAYGNSENTAEHTHNVAEIEDDSEEYRVDTTRKFKKNTGYLDGKERLWLLDFFPSLGKYVYHRNSWRKITVTESDVNYEAKELPSNYTFTYKYSDARPYLNLSRASGESLKQMDIHLPDIGNFTIAPRLVEFPRQQLGGGVLFPVQDPHSEEWGTTTADAIFSAFLSAISNRYSGNGEVGHKHINISVLDALSFVGGYLLYKGEKLKAGVADVAKELDGEAAILKKYIRRDIDDTAEGTITFEKVQKLVSGLLVGNFNNENGGSWTPDAEGRSHLITDYLEVRMKAIFEELVIKKTSTIGGKEIISPAGGVVAHKVEEVTVTYNNVSQKAYRCYFLAEQDGDEVDNDFAVNDQVRSESFNVRKGTYHKVGNHFYWRLVIGRDEEPVELEGKKYHYIDLSDTDCATASDVPAKGDVLSLCGNRTDIERQNCLIFSAVDTYSPSIGLYHGINSYSFANREYVEYGVNKQTNKAFFNVYGDMYVGDRPTKENNYEGSSYIKYDSATKQVSVKGKISAKSTVDGKELSQYIKENSAKGLTEEQVNNLIKNSQVIADLQNQVDGAIETWFYEGEPTLTNVPASSWTTDKDKDTHLGDLYYDNKTGKAYRFAKDGSIYKWTIITDTDIAKALSDASKAQETADGKMKVFSTQPTTPYQVGDIWVNATYPSDGSTYKNEVLRCQTNKAAGSQFVIGDWIKASRYTDDTVANAAKKAAEEAQKAALTAQTNITNLGKTVTSNKKAFDNYVTDGNLEPSEIAAMAQDSKRLTDDFAAAEKSYNEVKGAEVLKDTKELTDLTSAFTTLTTAKKELIEYLSDISSRYNAADTNGKATIVSAVGTKFTNFQSAYSAFYDKLGLANAYITSKIYGNLGVVIGDVTSLAYLKKALMDAPDTEINGGLVLTSLIGLRDTDGNTTAGINGITEMSAKGGGVAAWFGGEMVDKDYNDGSKTPANTIFRFDGSGYVAGGAIWWGTDGRVHADPTSFIISEKNLGAYLTFFEPTWKAGSAGTSVADLVSLKPNAPFTKLGVSGDASFEGAITFHGIKITYDSTNKAIKVDGNLYATGGITAYGEGSGSSGGSGLNGSVKSYADALKLTSESLSDIASAYSIKQLSTRITSLEGGSATSISVSGSGNAVTSVTKNGTTISIVKGATFLTSHQSLSAYLKSVDAANIYSKLGHTHSQYLTSHQSFTDLCATLSVGDGVVVNDTEFVTSIADANGFSNTSALNRPYKRKASKLWEYIKNKADSLYQPVGNYATQSWVNNKGYITSSSSISGNAATATNADKVDGYHAYQLFRDLGWWYNTETHNANDIEGNASVFAYSTHSNVQTTGVLTTFSGGNNAYNWQMIKSYSWRALYIRYRNGDTKTWSDWLRLLDENDLTWSNISNRPTKVSQFTNDSNYATQSWVTGKGYLTYHQDISGKVNRTGDYLDTDSDRWWLSNSEFGINLHNSDIVGVNSIYTSDVSNGPEESIFFKRSNGNYDTIRIADGKIWFGADYALNKTINEYQILHTNNISMSLTSDGFINTSVAGVTKQAYIYAIGSIDGYNSYPDGRTTSINDYTKGLNRLFLTHATSSLQANQKPLGYEGHILHFGWDNNGGWDAQLAVTNNGDKPYIAVRAQYNGTWRNWYGVALLKHTNYITGNGGLIVERTDKNLDTYMGVSNGTYDIRLMIGSGNVNRGIYDVSTGNWMLYRDSSMNIYMTGSVLATGGITAYSSSDIRLKQDLRKLDYLGIIKAMGGTFGFAWKKDNTRSIGFIAQHVLSNPYMRDIVETDENGYYKINYWSPKLIATAFGAIEQVGDEVSRLKARVVFLESEVQRLSGKQDGNNKKRLDNKNINLLN